MRSATRDGHPLHVHRLGYRPALDGLRGIAIVAVVLFHAAPSAVAGGYLGVDLFFVLSGFLITWLLMEEFASTGSISLRSFYARRARRLLPAFGGLAVATVSALPLIAADQRRATVASLVAGVSYIGNWLAAASHAPARGLGHVWSLAIEEQFYVVWSVAFVVLVRRGGRRAVVRLAVVGAVTGVMLRELFWRRGATAARVYYGTDTRGGALLLGAAVALMVCTHEVSRPRVRRVLAFGSIATAGYFTAALVARQPSFGIFSPTFPLTVVDVGAAVVIAWLFLSPARFATSALSHRALVFVGRRSYGLYLWHVPCIEAARAIFAGTSVSSAASAVGVTAASLATVVSYRFVERPFLASRRSHSIDTAATPAWA